MNNQFVDLFDVKKYGFNYWATLGLFIGGIVSSVIWKFISIFTFALDIKSILTLERFAVSFVYYLVFFALAFIGLSHILKKDIALPFAVGFVKIMWGIIFRGVGLSDVPIFRVSSIVMDFSWMFLTAAVVILFFRLIGNKLISFLIGFVLSAFLVRVLQLLIYSQSIDTFLRSALTGMISDFLIGLFFYAGLSYHFRKKRAFYKKS